MRPFLSHFWPERFILCWSSFARRRPSMRVMVGIGITRGGLLGRGTLRVSRNLSMTCDRIAWHEGPAFGHRIRKGVTPGGRFRNQGVWGERALPALVDINVRRRLLGRWEARASIDSKAGVWCCSAQTCSTESRLTDCSRTTSRVPITGYGRHQVRSGDV